MWFTVKILLNDVVKCTEEGGDRDLVTATAMGAAGMDNESINHIRSQMGDHSDTYYVLLPEHEFSWNSWTMKLSVRRWQ